MKYEFQIPLFPNSIFQIEMLALTGKIKLIKDGIESERSKKPGKPFIIYKESGESVEAFPKQTFPDMFPTVLEINNVKYFTVKKLSIFEYILGGTPLLLLLGGVTGAIIGYFALVVNYNIFRREGSQSLKIIKVIGIIVATYCFYLVLTLVMINK
jgi:hypothetical protein